MLHAYDEDCVTNRTRRYGSPCPNTAMRAARAVQGQAAAVRVHVSSVACMPMYASTRYPTTATWAHAHTRTPLGGAGSERRSHGEVSAQVPPEVLEQQVDGDIQRLPNRSPSTCNNAPSASILPCRVDLRTIRQGDGARNTATALHVVCPPVQRTPDPNAKLPSPASPNPKP